MNTKGTWIIPNITTRALHYSCNGVNYIKVFKRRHWLLFWLPRWKLVKKFINGEEQ